MVLYILIVATRLHWPPLWGNVDLVVSAVVAGAMALARQLGHGHTIVTILCDSGARYATKLFNPEFLRARNLPVPRWMEQKARAAPLQK